MASSTQNMSISSPQRVGKKWSISAKKSPSGSSLDPKGKSNFRLMSPKKALARKQSSETLSKQDAFLDGLPMWEQPVGDEQRKPERRTATILHRSTSLPLQQPVKVEDESSSASVSMRDLTEDTDFVFARKSKPQLVPQGRGSQGATTRRPAEPRRAKSNDSQASFSSRPEQPRHARNMSTDRRNESQTSFTSRAESNRYDGNRSVASIRRHDSNGSLHQSVNLNRHGSQGSLHYYSVEGDMRNDSHNSLSFPHDDDSVLVRNDSYDSVDGRCDGHSSATHRLPMSPRRRIPRPPQGYVRSVSDELHSSMTLTDVFDENEENSPDLASTDDSGIKTASCSLEEQEEEIMRMVLERSVTDVSMSPRPVPRRPPQYRHRSREMGRPRRNVLPPPSFGRASTEGSPVRRKMEYRRQTRSTPRLESRFERSNEPFVEPQARDSSIAEEEQEKEFIRIAMERSMQDMNVSMSNVGAQSYSCFEDKRQLERKYNPPAPPSYSSPVRGRRRVNNRRPPPAPTEIPSLSQYDEEEMLRRALEISRQEHESLKN